MANVLEQSAVEQLTRQFRDEISHLRQLQDATDKRRAQEEAAKKAAQAAAAEKQEDLLQQLLTAQVAEAHERIKKQSTLNKILAAVLVVLTGSGGAGVYFGTRVASVEQKAEDAAPVVKSVADGSRQIEARVDQAEKKIERLGEFAVDQQVQLSDSVEYLSEKIDAVNPKSAGKVLMPATVRAARMKADAIKRRRGESAVSPYTDPTDPFDGLE